MCDLSYFVWLYKKVWDLLRSGHTMVVACLVFALLFQCQALNGKNSTGALKQARGWCRQLASQGHWKSIKIKISQSINREIQWVIILSPKMMILQTVKHPISHIGVCYSNTSQKRGGGGTWHSRLHLI